VRRRRHKAWLNLVVTLLGDWHLESYWRKLFSSFCAVEYWQGIGMIATSETLCITCNVSLYERPCRGDVRVEYYLKGCSKAPGVRWAPALGPGRLNERIEAAA
jgi:hypothetical protein